jgi:hypothetical protein
MPLLLTVSLACLMLAAFFELELILGVAVITIIISLTAFGKVPRLLLWTLWVWLNIILIYLNCLDFAEFPNGEARLIGLPLPTFWMLVGVWILPVVVWPLGFALFFRSWMSK